MLKKSLIIIFIVLSLIITMDIFFKYEINPQYTEITEIFKGDYESTKKMSSDSLYKYKEFLEENEETADIFLVDEYIKYKESGLSSEEEDNIKDNIDKSKYLNSRIIGGSLLYNYYLENNKITEAKEIIIYIFGKINRQQFKNNVNEISYFLEMIASEASDKYVAIDILESLLDDNNWKMTDSIRLKIYNELRYLYIYINNYAMASEVSIQSIILSEQQNLNYQTSEALIELAQLFRKLEGIDSGIELIKKSLTIEIEDEFKNADLKTYGLLTLCELYLTKNDYNSAKLVSEYIPSYKESIPIEHYRDVEIIKANMDARIAIMENNLELAEEHLNYSKYLQEIDEEAYYLGKDDSYLLALGEFYEANNQYEAAVQLYESMLNEHQNNDYLLEKVLKSLIRVEEDSSKKANYYEKLLDLKERENEKRYGDYSFYILDKISNENKLIKQNESIKATYRFIIFLILFVGISISLLFKKIKDVKTKNKRDVLVDAYNRRHFDTVYKRLLNKNKLFSIIILDLDNFKKINDTFGHELGDIVLINTCKVIQPLLDERSSLFRYGGEEFIIIVEDTSRENVLQLAEKIRARVEALTWKEDIVTTLSIGVAYSDSDGDNIVNKADERLYISKNTGKNKVTG